MDVHYKALNLTAAARQASDLLVVLWPREAVRTEASAESLPLVQWVQAAVSAGLLLPDSGKSVQALGGDMARAKVVVAVQAGQGTPADVRKAVLAAMGLHKGAPFKTAQVYMGLLPEVGPAHVRAAVLAAADATYEFTTTKPSAKGRSLRDLTVLHPTESDGARWVADASAWLAGVEWAKEWANRPANHATPVLLAEAARGLTAHRNMSVEVLGHKDVAKLGMGAFLAVAQGSAQPLRFIVVRYTGAEKSRRPLALIGKGITFDTGGISIKPAPEMDEMKFDMAGAASVLGCMHSIGLMQPRINVVALVPACENMPDGGAIKPGDVVTSMSGQTIEILNTDAEGRLVLCDALTYVQRFKPDHVIDVATLTGACVIALGHTRTGVFSNNAELSQQLQQAGDLALDPCWPMPLDDEYAEGLKSNFADMANVAGRPGGSVSAAKFLQKFVGDLRWAHLDIAGTAWRSGAAKGATGRPVGLLLQHVLSHAEAAPPPKSARPSRSKSAKS